MSERPAAPLRWMLRAKLEEVEDGTPDIMGLIISRSV